MDQGFNELFKYLQIVYTRRYLCLLIALTVMTGIIAYSYSLPRKYEADSTVFIEENVIKNLVKGIAVTPEMEDRVRVLKYALVSRDIISKVLAELEIDSTTHNDSELQALITSLQERIQISVKERNGLFTVSIVDDNPRFAQGFINRLINRYLEENLSAKREESYGASRFLHEQLALQKEKLDKAEDTIIEFRKSQGIFLSRDEKSLLEDINQYQKEIVMLRLSSDTLKARRQQLSGQLKSLDPTVAIFSEKQVEDRIATLERRLGQLLLAYTENYPEVIRVKAEIDALRQGGEKGEEGLTESRLTAVNPLHQEIQQQRLTVEAEISSLVARQRLLKELIIAREGELKHIPENRKQLAVLEQERDSHRKLYEDLLARLGQSEVSKQMEIGGKTTNFRVVDPAVFPTVPVSPDMVRMILLAIAGGLAAGVGAAIFRDFLDGSVKNVSQLQELGVEVLAVIPRVIIPQAEARRRRKDILVFSAASVYLVGVVCLLAFEAAKRIA
ncbi:XrtA system polysaccharide chain length determinant [Desulfuromonas sp. TF]|uniref:XrtA system polysaccharide chain length determinant n=1 Tax=Desulfuromonas sp. TF TaxID=1232410 RepID=UPI000416F7AD|nr:XrtA system polysaccharide chain length determinant [Desulfuromonas sp. TF]